jgi:glyoxylase-like metal-dependent hydrolase (beta-lactamase superfamily II)
VRGLLRWLFRLVGGAVVLALLVAAVAIGWVRYTLAALRTPLPPAAGVAGTSQASEVPVRISWFNTASQFVPRSALIDTSKDADPEAWARMSFPVFVLEWADGRILLVDAGMDGPTARRFGVPIERAVGGDPIEPIVDVAAALGPARDRVAGIVFTHLHEDHVQGVETLCRAGAKPVEALLASAQAEHPYYHTRPSLELLRRTPCVRVKTLPAEPMSELPGFPGVVVIAAAGHTPGTQLVVAHVGSREARPIVLAGDVANLHAGIELDRAKPWLYRLLVVPEDEGRLGEVREYLRDLEQQFGVTALVSHDQAHLEASTLLRWPMPGA